MATIGRHCHTQTRPDLNANLGTWPSRDAGQNPSNIGQVGAASTVQRATTNADVAAPVPASSGRGAKVGVPRLQLDSRPEKEGEGFTKEAADSRVEEQPSVSCPSHMCTLTPAHQHPRMRTHTTTTYLADHAPAQRRERSRRGHTPAPQHPPKRLGQRRVVAGLGQFGQLLTTNRDATAGKACEERWMRKACKKRSKARNGHGTARTETSNPVVSPFSLSLAVSGTWRR